MNQKPSKPNKLEFPKQLIPNRVRSVFNDITNISTDFISQPNYKRRNAIIPCDAKLLEINLYQKKQSHIPINENWKGPISYFLNYEKEIYQLENEIELKSKKSKSVAEQHNFTESELEEALDWMVYKMRQFFRTSYETIFQAIELVYQFLQNSFHLQFADLELITGCCIYLASKTVDYYPVYVGDLLFDVQQYREQVLANKFSNDEVIRTENRICQVLHYNLLIHTPLQIVYRILFENKKLLENYYEQGQIQILTQKIIQNLLFMVMGQRFRSVTIIYKALSSILLTFFEHKIDLRIVRY